MNIEHSLRRVVGGLGWIAAWVFWAVIFGILVSLLSANGDSGASMVIYFGIVIMGMTFPLLTIPAYILIYGVRKDHGLPLPRTLFKWGTIATVTYLACLAIALLFMQ